MTVTSFILGSLLSILLIQGPLHAQQLTDQPTPPRLKSLYELLLKNPESTYTQERIAEERQRLRHSAEEEIRTSFASAFEEGKGTFLEIIEQQRALVTSIEERIRERRVDLDLLQEEEQQYLTPPTGTGSVDIYSLTESHAELLANRALLEERLATLDALYALQQSKLEKLTAARKNQQIALFTTMGKYAAILAVIWFVEKLTRTLLLSRLRNLSSRYTATKIFTSSVYTLTTLWLLTLLFSEHPGILASFAIVGAGLAISLQDCVKDCVGWFVILQYNLFTKGDRISVGTYTGEVIDIGILRTTLLEVGTPDQPTVERTGRTLFMPNSLVLIYPLFNANTTSDYTKSELRFEITFESNWKKAGEILQEILQQETGAFAEAEQLQHDPRTRMFFIPYEPSTPKVFKTIAADGIQYILKFSAPIGEWRPVISRITEKVLERFAQAGDIALAYKTSRVYASTIEGSQKKEDPPHLSHALPRERR